MIPQTFDAIVTLIAAAAEKKDDGWFDSSVVVAIVSGIAAIAVALLSYLGIRATLRARASEPGKPPKEPPPDLADAADARVEALREYGPGRDELLPNSRRDLQLAAAAFGKRKHAGVRKLALQLAQCSDLTEAAALRDQIAQASR